MWPKSYRDYPEDKPLVKHKVQPGNGIVGCEMHEINGWGEHRHKPRVKNRKKGFIRSVIGAFFNIFNTEGER